MKIAFFTETWYPNVDGVVVAISNTKERLEKLGNEVIVFAAGTADLKKRRKKDAAYIFPSVDFIPYPTYKLAIFPYPDAEEIARKEKVDIIHSHGMGPMGLAALYAATILKKPLIGTLHTNIQEATHYIAPIKPMQKIMKRVAWRYLRWYYNQCDKVIVPSEYMRKECIKNGIKNVEVISNGIDLDRFKPGEKKMWKDRTVVLYTGRLVKEKNLEVLIKAAHLIKKEIPNVLFVIVGSGPMEQTYKEMVKKHKVEDLFIFISGVRHKGIVEFYHNADVFAFPSMFETQGLSCLEALACGLPVAGADYLAIPDLVKEGYNGYLFKPHDVKGCAAAVVKCIRNKKKLAENAIKIAKEHSIEKSIRRQIKIYHELINTPSKI
ncbi:MAG: glycosyltransferase [Candidatus Micrarchaeota archaeon]|nr:glycosyltransferase [Candidatus Micrarchaeota archaeon]